MSHLVKLLAALAALTLLTGCPTSSGGSDGADDDPTDAIDETGDEGSEEVSKEDWVDEVNMGCAEWQAGREVDAGESFTGFIEQVGQEAMDYYDVISAPALPTDGARSDAEEWLDLQMEATGIIADGAEQVTEGDWAAGLAAMDQAQPVAFQADEMADELGLDSCVADEASREFTLSDLLAQGIAEQYGADYTEEQATCLGSALIDGVLDGSIADLDAVTEEELQPIADRCLSS